MKTFYFVGGPVAGQAATFFRRLKEVGGAPPDWQIYPHAGRDGRALHVVHAESEMPILAHLAQFEPIYQHGPIVEIVGKADGRTRQARA